MDENPELAQRFAIQSIPTLFLFHQGKAQDRLVGVPGRRQLLDQIDAHDPHRRTTAPAFPVLLEETARKSRPPRTPGTRRDPGLRPFISTVDSEWRNRSSS